MTRLVVGCGYLGKRVARIWRDAGNEVYATTRGQRRGALESDGLWPVRLDVTKGPVAPLPRVDTVVFAVGRSGDDTMFDVQVAGLQAVLDALPSGTGRVIYVSSTGVYAQDAGEWVDETSDCAPLRDGGKACLAAERLLADHARGRNGVVLRLAGLYGPGRIPRAADIESGRTIPGSPDAYLNLIHVKDAAEAVVQAGAVSREGRIYAVSDGHPPTRRAYVTYLAAQRGLSPPRFSGGGGLGKRVRNTRALNELGLRLAYPSYREGLAAT